MNTIGFEEPHLRRRKIKNFNFERNKTEEVEDTFEEALLMKKEKILAVSPFTAGKSPQPDNNPLFGDPLSSNPLNKKLKSEFIPVDIFLKKVNVGPTSMVAPPFNPSSLVSISSSSLYSSTKSGSKGNLKRKKYAKIFTHYLKPFPKYFI